MSVVPPPLRDGLESRLIKICLEWYQVEFLEGNSKIMM